MSKYVRITGTKLADLINGTDLKDKIKARKGDDLIAGRAGNDIRAALSLQLLTVGFPFFLSEDRPRLLNIMATESWRVSDALRRAERFDCAGRDTKHAKQDQDKAELFRRGEWLVQDNGCENRDRQRHHPGKQRSGMRRRREQQAGIGQQHRRAAAEHDRRQADPAEAFERKTIVDDVWQQQQTGDAEAKCCDIPRREAGL